MFFTGCFFSEAKQRPLKVRLAPLSLKKEPSPAVSPVRIKMEQPPIERPPSVPAVETETPLKPERPASVPALLPSERPQSVPPLPTAGVYHIYHMPFVFIFCQIKIRIPSPSKPPETPVQS